MGKHSRITFDEYKQFVDAVNVENLTVAAAAKRLGRTPEGFRDFSKRNDLMWPSRKQETDIKENTCTASRTKKIECEIIVNYIQKNGGTIKNAIEATGVKVAVSTVRGYALKNGFDVSMFRNAYKRYGYWILMPSKMKKKYKNDYELQALCTKCNTVHSVMATNIRSGQSKSCKACARNHRSLYTVVCEETGKTYRSILNLSKELGMRRQYLTIRKRLLTKGLIEINGSHYTINNENTKES